MSMNRTNMDRTNIERTNMERTNMERRYVYLRQLWPKAPATRLMCVFPDLIRGRADDGRGRAAYGAPSVIIDKTQIANPGFIVSMYK